MMAQQIKDILSSCDRILLIDLSESLNFKNENGVENHATLSTTTQLPHTFPLTSFSPGEYTSITVFCIRSEVRDSNIENFWVLKIYRGLRGSTLYGSLPQLTTQNSSLPEMNFHQY